MCSQEKTLQETLNNAYKRMLGIFREKLGSTGLPPAISVLSAAGQDSQGKCGADEENQIKTKWQTPPETFKIASSKCFRAKRCKHSDYREHPNLVRQRHHPTSCRPLWCGSP